MLDWCWFYYFRRADSLKVAELHHWGSTQKHFGLNYRNQPGLNQWTRWASVTGVSVAVTLAQVLFNSSLNNSVPSKCIKTMSLNDVYGFTASEMLVPGWAPISSHNVSPHVHSHHHLFILQSVVENKLQHCLSFLYSFSLGQAASHQHQMLWKHLVLCHQAGWQPIICTF